VRGPPVGPAGATPSGAHSLLDSAVRATAFTAAAAAVEDITGTTISFVAPTVPVRLVASARRFKGSVINGTYQVQITDDANNIYAHADLVVPNVTGMQTLEVPLVLDALLDTLTPGVTYTYKLRTFSSTGVTTVTPGNQGIHLLAIRA